MYVLVVYFWKNLDFNISVKSIKPIEFFIRKIFTKG